MCPLILPPLAFIYPLFGNISYKLLLPPLFSTILSTVVFVKSQ